MKAADAEIAQQIPPSWHAACAVGTSIGFPMAAASALMGAATGQDAFWWTAVAVFVLVAPFVSGIELLARSLVKTYRGSLRGWAAEVDISRMRMRLLSWSLLKESLLALGVDPGIVLAARRGVWFVSGALVLVSFVIGLV